jgi:peptidoglycan hydrolase FlgJ
VQVTNVVNNHPYPVKSAKPHAPAAIDRKGDLYKACQDFEALFVKQMLDAMRKTVDKSNDMLGGTGMGQDVFEGMLYDEYAKKMSQTAGFGLAEMIYRQVSSKS